MKGLATRDQSDIHQLLAWCMAMYILTFHEKRSIKPILQLPVQRLVQNRENITSQSARKPTFYSTIIVDIFRGSEILMQVFSALHIHYFTSSKSKEIASAVLKIFVAKIAMQLPEIIVTYRFEIIIKRSLLKLSERALIFLIMWMICRKKYYEKIHNVHDGQGKK